MDGGADGRLERNPPRHIVELIRGITNGARKIESLPALDHGALNVIVETWKGQRSRFEFDSKRGKLP